MRESIRGWNAGALRTTRRAAGLSQEELGALSGCSGSAVGAWESGDRAPQPKHAVALAEALEVDLQTLVDIDPGDATLLDLRAWAGITQSTVRQVEGLSRISAIERGVRPLPDDRVDQLAELYGVDSGSLAAAADRSRAEWYARVRQRRSRL